MYIWVHDDAQWTEVRGGGSVFPLAAVIAAACLAGALQMTFCRSEHGEVEPCVFFAVSIPRLLDPFEEASINQHDPCGNTKAVRMPCRTPNPQVCSSSLLPGSEHERGAEREMDPLSFFNVDADLTNDN